MTCSKCGGSEREPCEHGVADDGHPQWVTRVDGTCKRDDCPPGADENCTVPAGGGGDDRSGECGDCCGRDERCDLDPDNECLIIEHQRDELVHLRATNARMTPVVEAAVAEFEALWKTSHCVKCRADETGLYRRNFCDHPETCAAVEKARE